VPYPPSQSYSTREQASVWSPPSTDPAASAQTAPSNIPVGPTAPAEGPPTGAPITPSPVAAGWSSWSTTKKAVVVGGGVVGLAAVVGIIKALVR
jgi:hypothetical protein